MLNGFKSGGRFFKHRHPIDRLAEINAMVGGLALYPQLFKILIDRQVEDLAPTSFVIFLLSNTVWHIYGWHRKALPVIVSSALTATAATVILILLFILKR